MNIAEFDEFCDSASEKAKKRGLKHGASTETNPQSPIGFVELATLSGFSEIVSDLMKAGATIKLTTSTVPISFISFFVFLHIAMKYFDLAVRQHHLR